MYRQIIIPTVKNHTIDLPKEFYGVKIEVIAFSLQDNAIQEMKTNVDPDTFYDNIKLDFSGYKFDRNEANER